MYLINQTESKFEGEEAFLKKISQLTIISLIIKISKFCVEILWTGHSYIILSTAIIIEIGWELREKKDFPFWAPNELN